MDLSVLQLRARDCKGSPKYRRWEDNLVQPTLAISGLAGKICTLVNDSRLENSVAFNVDELGDFAAALVFEACNLANALGLDLSDISRELLLEKLSENAAKIGSA
jgi:hypothetical protein